MDTDSSIIDSFLRRIGFLLNLAGIISIVLLGLYAIYRIPITRKLRANAVCPRERMYFGLVLHGCYAGAYSFLITVLTMISIDDFGEYWPAISACWTSNGGIGEIGHSTAIVCDAIISLVACGLFMWRASSLGRSEIACDGTEIFLSR